MKSQSCQLIIVALNFEFIKEILKHLCSFKKQDKNLDKINSKINTAKIFIKKSGKIKKIVLL